MRIGTIGTKGIFATSTGFKVGGKGRVSKPGAFLRTLPKGTARKLRKAARAAGFRRHAAS